MTNEEVREFLLAQPRTAMMATVRADGRPHAVPIWFDLDGEEIVFTVGGSTVKGANLRRDPRVALCVNDDTPPYAYVLIEGTVTYEEEAPDLRAWATRLGGRYMGADRAEEFGARNGIPGEWLARLRPTNIVGHSGITD
jgi:PPOX class probable F420-dependent enzyme